MSKTPIGLEPDRYPVVFWHDRRNQRALISRV